jgi:hypothetical protein
VAQQPKSQSVQVGADLFLRSVADRDTRSAPLRFLMDAKDFGEIADATDQIVAMVTGFKTQMMEAGFSIKIAEAGALEFLKMLMAAASPAK